MRPKRLADYLDDNSWSQADLARQAGVSTGVVSRALNGGSITRKSAKAIVEALDQAQQSNSTQLRAAHVTLASVRGLHITRLQRKSKKRGGNRHLLGPENLSE